ncbi:hypothetical protein V6238_00150 [Marinomonas arenicola]|uniref:hypothetical protein n=1 Tax=Marinomonas arenicola TaxID=569601 RepID=UPI00311F0F8A
MVFLRLRGGNGNLIAQEHFDFLSIFHFNAVEKGSLRHENNHKSIACSDHNDYFEHGVAADIPETALLKAWNAEFLKDIVHVVDNVYTFTGYSVQSVSMIVGKDGLIIVDTGIDSASTKKVLAINAKNNDAGY